MFETFRAFCGHLQIPSKDRGIVPFAPLWGSQAYLLRELEAGREQGISEFIVLKGRQLGITTIMDALDLWYLQSHPGLVGLLVSDDDDNRDYRRDVLLQMLASLPRTHRWPVRLNNRGQLAWAAPNRSRLLFAAAGGKFGSNLGRSKGLNYLHGDEVGSWPDPQAVAALRAALSTQHPARFYVWNSTARGFNVLHEMWKAAERALTQRAIFVGWWRHEGYAVTRATRDLWNAYGEPPARPSERQWMTAIQERYEIVIQPEQLAWYRWQLAEEFFGDEALLAQEFPTLPEEAFQAFGDKFMAPALIQQLRLKVALLNAPRSYEYEWGASLDTSEVRPAEDGRLRVWQEPDPEGVYIVSAHPSWSSSPKAPQFVCQVWRAWPDHLSQAVEYASDHGAMYQFAWIIAHLAGAYRTALPVWMILEVGTTGLHVLNELQRLDSFGYGLSPQARERGRALIDLVGSMRQYFYRRPDTMSSRALLQWKTGPQNRPWLLHGLRDELERAHVDVRSPELVEELGWLRRGESGNADEIAAGGLARDDRAITAALAVECWLKLAMPDLLDYVTPKARPLSAPTHTGEALVQTFLSRLVR